MINKKNKKINNNFLNQFLKNYYLKSNLNYYYDITYY